MAYVFLEKPYNDFFILDYLLHLKKKFPKFFFLFAKLLQNRNIDHTASVPFFIKT
jgi:pilus assembly protein TadC